MFARRRRIHGQRGFQMPRCTVHRDVAGALDLRTDFLREIHAGLGQVRPMTSGAPLLQAVAREEYAALKRVGLPGS